MSNYLKSCCLIEFLLLAELMTNFAILAINEFYPSKQSSNEVVKKQFWIPVDSQPSLWSELKNVITIKSGLWWDIWEDFFVEID